ncbi:MAG: hypothetical protein AAGD92_08655 [Pseudomonadota bacterium]
MDPAAFPATIETPVAAAAIDASVHADEGGNTAKRAALIAIGLGALGWLVKLLGPKKVIRAVEKTAEATVNASVKASGAAVKTVARAARSPLRYMAWIAGLALFALTGVGLYDIEWIGGLVAGAALAGVAAFTSIKARNAFRLRPIPIRKDKKDNQN